MICRLGNAVQERVSSNIFTQGDVSLGHKSCCKQDPAFEIGSKVKTVQPLVDEELKLCKLPQMFTHKDVCCPRFRVSVHLQ